MLGPAPARGEAGLLAPGRIAHHREPARPLMLLARRDRHPAVARGQEGHRRVRGRGRGLPPDLARPLQGVELRLVERRDGLLERHVEMSPAPISPGQQETVQGRRGHQLPGEQGRGVTRGLERRQVERLHLEGRKPVREARGVEGDHVVARPLGLRPREPERRDGDTDQPGVELLGKAFAKAQALGRPRARALEHEVGPAAEPLGRFPRSGLGPIHPPELLGAVQVVEETALGPVHPTGGKRSPGSGRVAILRLDLHHLRAEVGQELSAIRSGHVLGQLQNAHPVEKSIGHRTRTCSRR